MLTRIAQIIKDKNYESIMSVEDWAGLTLIIEGNETPIDAEDILTALSIDVEHVMSNALDAAFIVLDNKWYRMISTINEEKEKLIYYIDEETGDEYILDLLNEDDISNAKTAVFFQVIRME